MKIQKFRVLVAHDSGKTPIVVQTESKERAKKMVMTSEECPESAIISVRKVANKS